MTCLQTADHLSNIKSMAIPAISAGIFGMDPWAVSHEAAKALIDFDRTSAGSKGDLTDVEFVCLDLFTADAMNVVFRHGLIPPIVTPTNLTETENDRTPSVDEELPTVEDIPSDQTSEPAVSGGGNDPDLPPVRSVAARSGPPPEVDETNDWYTIRRILKEQRRKGKDFYLVEWETDPVSTSWVEGKDVTDYALQTFFSSRPQRRKRRRRYY